MPCYRPLDAYRGLGGGVSFSRTKSLAIPIRLPCGRCIGCKLERSRQWAVRMMHEASLHEDNAFITLTFSDEHVPADGSLNVRTHQKFMDRLRKRAGHPVRYFLCGEYGEQLERPHYHACLFGFDFPDRELWSENKGNRLYRSDMLDSLWKFGHALTGALTFESAAYVAGYVTKKITGQAAKAKYGDRLPPYGAMSRRPGIGAGWIERFYSDVYPSDEVIARGFPSKPPRYYDKFFEALAPEEAESVRRVRRENRNLEDETRDRLAVREVCTQARLRTYSRRDVE